jgi:hypothetical protein
MRFAIIMMSAALVCVQVGAQAVTGSQGTEEVKLDPAQIRLEIRNFETVLNNTVTAAFSSSPFALVQKVKGVYLPGYGMSFTFLINIHRAMVSTPFGEIRRGESVTPDQKKRRIEELLNKLTAGLQENGGSFRQLRKEESVTIVAFIEDRNFPDEANQNKTVLLSATERDLQEFAGQTNRFQEFRQRVKTIEY